MVELNLSGAFCVCGDGRFPMSDGRSALMQQLHDEHGAALLRFCMHLTGQDPGRAEDVAQETLLRAWRNVSVLDQSQGSLRSWLFTVARNIVIDDWRTKRSRKELSMAAVPEGTDTGDRTDELILSWVVGEAISTLSAEHRAVLLECYYRGASVAEAAGRLSVPEGTVKSRTYYALRALRLALEEMGVSP
jgi:RNA polymerase sigma-70 factor (ECF subfamily)